MIYEKLDIYCCCISTNRPANVEMLERRTALKWTYYTRPNESKAYYEAGASNVVEVDGNICKARNQAIEDANGKICLQISDDYKNTHIVRGGKEGKYSKRPYGFLHSLDMMVTNFRKANASYAGTAITENLFYYNGKPIQFNKLIVNDCILLDGKMKFDEKADLKEDYDMFVRTVQSGLVVMRFNLLLMGFPHRGNKGGANDYRTREREKECNMYILKKHSGIIVPHKTRENQVEINYKKLLGK
jgi:hypothetical protein|tara:strand:+ start:363 stop:1094 length:732 start_codon:yes stop_codon:yes gene_type:complete